MREIKAKKNISAILLLPFFTILLCPFIVYCQTKPPNQFAGDLEKLLKETIIFREYSDVEFKNVFYDLENEINIKTKKAIGRNELNEKERAFFNDTIRIAAYYGQFDDISTQGMNEGYIFYNAAFDLLLNKYYKLALGTLTDEYKKGLVTSQRIWLDYYIKEKDFLFSLYSTGLANSLLYIWPTINEVMVQRVNTLYYIYLGVNNNEQAIHQK